MTSTLTEQTPFEIDSRLAEIYAAKAKLQGRIESTQRHMRNQLGDSRDWIFRGRTRVQVWNLTEEEVAARSNDWESYVQSYDKAAYLENSARLTSLYAELVELITVSKALEDEFDRRPWSRFFLVTSSNGHIHRDMNCSTCYPTTGYGWLPSLSGKTEAEAVAEQGPFLCSVCFTSAPTEWTRDRDEVKAEAEKGSLCAGGGTYDYDPKTARRGYVSGNAGTCTHCDARVSLTASAKLRKHKRETK